MTLPTIYREEHEQFREQARRFIAREIAPFHDAWEKDKQVPRELWRKAGEAGLLCMTTPEQYGGLGADLLFPFVLNEELAKVFATGPSFGLHSDIIAPYIVNFGTEEQKQKWLAPLASGQLLGCFALSEPDAGSDAAAQKTVARQDGDGWVINGVKNWITNGPNANVCILQCMADPPGKHIGHKAITTFILPMDLPGVRTGPADKKLGIRGSQSSQIFLDDVRVGKDLLLGGVGTGFKVAMSTLDGGRIGIASQALGIARASFEDAGRYALDRKTFGQPIANHQAIQWKLADMATELDAARLLTLRAASLKDRGVRFSKEAAMAKLFASECANRAAKECVQIFGGNGYVEDYPAERHYRDAKITEIYEGTSEIMRIVIASALLKE